MFASNVKINKRKTWAFNRKYGFEKLSRKKKKQSIEFLAGETETESCEIYGKENHNF